MNAVAGRTRRWQRRLGSSSSMRRGRSRACLRLNTIHSEHLARLQGAFASASAGRKAALLHRLKMAEAAAERFEDFVSLYDATRERCLAAIPSPLTSTASRIQHIQLYCRDRTRISYTPECPTAK